MLNHIQEDFLHFVWKHRFIPAIGLKSTNGQEIEILKIGDHNTNAGPDFLNAQINIDGTHWAGSVEIHVKTSDWQAHGHQNDRAYNNVILHVVYENDLPDNDKSKFPVLELKTVIPEHTLSNYEALKEGKHWIPCEPMVGSVSEFSRAMWLERVLVDRLESRADKMLALVKENNNDWAEATYQLFARNFGFKVNAMTFEALAKSVAQKILAKHKNNLFQIEAILFGQAGFLWGNYEDEYPNKLQKEYNFLARKYELKPLDIAQWRFLRMRPGNFPTYRISQFAGLVQHSEHLFSRILEIKNVKEALKLFEVKASSYWDTHHIFDKESARKATHNMGDDSRRILIINGVVPVLFSYGHIKGIEKYKEKALEILDTLPKEENAILSKWESLGFENKSAGISQALLQLKNEYCSRQLCLKCAIGTYVLRPDKA